MKYLGLILIFSYTHILIGQNTPVALFNYDNCDLSDNTGTYMAGIEQGTIDCECGVEMNAMELDGFTGCATLDPELKNIFLGDFTFSFYFSVDSHTMPSSLFSVKEDCNSRDSTMSIKYYPQSDELEIIFSENIIDRINFRTRIDPEFCWNQALISKSGEAYNFYLNGNFIDRQDINRTVTVNASDPFLLGSSPCNGVVEQKFHGKIDEITFYDRPLNADEVNAQFTRPDQILSSDTTIFVGNSVVINFDGTCGIAAWSPTEGLSNDIINPVANPDVSTQYVLSINQGFCTSRDTININVISEEDITCSQLLLPNAFTPNGDGLNDDFGVSNLFIVDQLESFVIYDRWGAEIFISNIKGGRWDGSFDGSPVNPGMYAYKVSYQCDGESYEKIGGVSVMR